MTGTGTSTDPYIPYTWDELTTALSTSGAYIELAANIDLNNEYPEGIPSTTKIYALQLDGKGYAVRNIRCENLKLFDPYFTGTVFKNVSIENIRFTNTGTSTLQLIHPSYSSGNYIKFSEVRLSGTLNGNTAMCYVNDTWERCSLNIKYDGNFETANHYAYGLKCKDCNLRFEGKSNSKLRFTLNNSYLGGKIEGDIETIGVNAASVINADVSGAISNSGTVTNVIANSDRVASGTIASAIDAVTTEQMKDAEYLSSIGFPIGVES